MNNSPDDQFFISGIYNYCDGWCDRCPFTDRCRAFAAEQESLHDPEDLRSVVRTIRASLKEAKQMLIEKAEELGIDPFSITDEDFAEIRRREKAYVDGDELARLTERYWRSAKMILDDDTLSEDPSLIEVFSVLTWYLFLIPVKVHRGLHGLLDEDGFEDESQRTDSQSDANGTVKVGLIAIERSLLAWRQLAEAGHADRVSPVIDLLNEITEKLEKRFPLARDFIRPGFDEIEMVM